MKLAGMKLKDHLLWTWGCEVWFSETEYVNNSTRRRRGVFLGLSDLKLGYVVLDLETGKVVYTRDCKFIERSFPFKETLPPCTINLDPSKLPSHEPQQKVSVDSESMTIAPPVLQTSDEQVVVEDEVSHPQAEDILSPIQQVNEGDWEGELLPIPLDWPDQSVEEKHETQPPEINPTLDELRD